MSLNTQQKIAPGDIRKQFSLDALNPKLKILLHTRVLTFYLERKKICEKWNFSPVINMTFNAIPKY